MLRSAFRARLVRPPLLLAPARRSAWSQPRYFLDGADPCDQARIDSLVNEWQDAVHRQKSGTVAHVARHLKDLGVTPIPRYALTVDPSEVDAPQVEALLRQQASLTRNARLLELGVRLEQPPWRLRGTAEGIDVAEVLARLERWDGLRAERRFEEADTLKRELFVAWDVKLLTTKGRRQFRRRRRGEEDIDEAG